MKLSKYNKFIKENKSFNDLEALNENLDRARKLLKERETIKQAAQELGLLTDDLKYKMDEGEIRTLKLNDFEEKDRKDLIYKMKGIKIKGEELKRLEQDKSFQKLKKMLSQNMGYMYNFTYMHFVEKIPINELEVLFNDIIEYKNLLPKLNKMEKVGRNFDANFIDTSIPNEKEQRTNAEIISDGIKELEDYKRVKKILDQLPKKMRRQYDTAPKLVKDELSEVARGFEQLSDEKTESGMSVRERVWRNFFGEMVEDTHEFTEDGEPNPTYGKMVFSSRIKKYENEVNPLRSLVMGAKKHLEASASVSEEYDERKKIINEVSKKFGKMGVDVVFDENGIIIVNVNSYAANHILNAHAGDHCIVYSQSYWDSYIGEYNKQYYLYNTNISKIERLSTIGVTIQPDKNIKHDACQDVQNNSVRDRFNSILKSWEEDYNINEDLFSLLKPMSEEEVEKRKRAKLADREIIKKGLSIDQIRQYVTEDGADINKNNAIALINATEEGDYEKIKLCLELGASPNLTTGNNAAISKAKDFDTIKLLVSYGAELTSEVLQNVINDTDALKYCLDAGLNINMGKSRPIRVAIKGSYKNESEPGEAYNEAIQLILNQSNISIGEFTNTGNTVVNWAIEYGRLEILKMFKEKGFFDNVSEEAKKGLIEWGDSAMRRTPEVYEEVLNYIRENV